MPKKPISAKQQKCANFYLQGMSMKKAMIKAGYAEAYAHTACAQFLKNKGIIKYIRERHQAEADAALADSIYIKKKLMDLVDSADREVSLAALKQLDAHNKWQEEVENRLKEAEARIAEAENKEEEKGITINIGKVESDGD